MPAPTLDTQEPTRRITAYRVVALTIILGVLGLWAYALTRKAEPAPDKLDDAAFSVSAQDICTATMAQLDQLPQAFQSASADDRADVVAQTDTDLGAMLDALRANVPAAERDQGMLNEWIGDWQTYLDNRIDYVNRLARTTTHGSTWPRRTGARSRWPSIASLRSMTCRRAARRKTSASPRPAEAAPSEANQAVVHAVARELGQCHPTDVFGFVVAGRLTPWWCEDDVADIEMRVRRPHPRAEHVDVEIDRRPHDLQTGDACLFGRLAKNATSPRSASPSACPPGCSQRPALACSIRSSRSRSSCTTKAEPVKCPASHVRNSESGCSFANADPRPAVGAGRHRRARPAQRRGHELRHGRHSDLPSRTIAKDARRRH